MLNDFPCLQDLVKRVAAQVAVAKDLGEQAWTDCLAGMDWNNRSPAVGVPQKMVATLYSCYLEPSFS